MQYKILWAYSCEELEPIVNSHIKDGWEPQGGLAILPNDHSSLFYQAVIKKAEWR